ncbi:H-2 class II histocompatibility antigen, E-S beta chain-like [Scyliorhinus canicula]|uniref:H-2 class II histocompatibility antigen, E-S beta chain-like n=1 Tax=Scyliorhinus canicula TaxID=7830 RepID=UPI0018F79137|nr:H-2 class II histocompatibility antigen, E-S beta chain-like [Scyliorhinus canicula]
MPVSYRWAFVAVAATIISVLDMVDCLRDMRVYVTDCSCIYRDHKLLRVTWDDAFDGAPLYHYDSVEGKMVADQAIGQAEVDRQNSDSIFIQSLPSQIESLCDKMKQAAISSNTILDKKAPIPSKVFLQEKSGQMNLVCLVKDFFPRDIKMRWLRNGVVIANEPQTVNIVPQRNRTFQARSLLSLNGDVDGSYSCQVEHETLTKKLVLKFEHSSITKNEALIIIGAVLGILGISFAVVTGILYYCNLNRTDQFSVNPTAKFTKRAGPCGRNPCNSSVRSSSSETSNTSNTSCSSADDLTKSHA